MDLFGFMYIDDMADLKKLRVQHAMAVMTGATLGSPPSSNHLWFLMFETWLWHCLKSYGMLCTSNTMYVIIYPSPSILVISQAYTSEQTPFSETGIYAHHVYWRYVLGGNLSLHSHCLMLWANLSAVCVALLTQPKAHKKQWTGSWYPVTSWLLSVTVIYCVG